MSEETESSEEQERHSHPVEEIALGDIEIDENFKNCRVPKPGDEEKLRTLMTDMESRGLVHPIRVREEIHKSGIRIFHLRSGFRRHQAAHRLGWSVINATVIPSDAPEVNDYLDNIGENLVRQDLTPYEIAESVVRMRKRFNMSPRQFAQRHGLSINYVQQITRWLEHLPEEIIEDWKAGHPLLSFRQLAKLYGEFTPENAVLAWKKMQGISLHRPPNPGPGRGHRLTPLMMGEVDIDADEDDDKRANLPKRPTMRRLAALYAAILGSRDLSGLEKRLALNIVEFAQGTRRTIPGLIIPRARLLKKQEAPSIAKKSEDVDVDDPRKKPKETSE